MTPSLPTSERTICWPRPRTSPRWSRNDALKDHGDGFYVQREVECLSYEPNLPDLFRRAADYVEKIMRERSPLTSHASIALAGRRRWDRGRDKPCCDPFAHRS